MMFDELSGKKKAAILMLMLGEDIAGEIYKHLDEGEVKEVTLEIANTGMGAIPKATREEIAKSFVELTVAQDYISSGGITYAKKVLEKALGTQKAIEIINQLTSTLQVRPFEFARKADPTQLLNYLQNEHPQTVALVLAYLKPKQAAAILSALPEEKRHTIAKRIAKMDRTSPKIIKRVEKVLERKLSAVVNQDYTSAGGVDKAVEVMSNVDRGTEKSILSFFENEDPELAEEIRNKLFTFEDILLLDDRSVQRVIREIDNEDMVLALKHANDEVKDKIFSNMTSRLAETIKEDMGYTGPVRLRDIEEKQQLIVACIRRLEDAGEIIVSRGGGDEIIE